MRHLLGFLLAAVMAAALFFAATWGYTWLTVQHGVGLTGPRGLAALGAVAGTGLLLGLLLCVPWVSPLATGLPGLLLLGWTGVLAGSPQLALRYIPLKGYVFGSGFHTLLVNGVLALAGVAMIIPMFLPSRWSRRGGEEEEYDEDPLSLSASTTTGLLS